MKVRIYLPVFNCQEKMEQTMNSIRQLRFPQDRIEKIIIDYGSTDGTYERLLEYDISGLGIYRVEKKVSPKNKYEIYEKIAKGHGGDSDCFHIALKPGDILYSNSLSYVEETMCHFGNIDGVVCETCVLNEEGEVVKQVPLFSKAYVLTLDNRSEYLRRGFSHKVISFQKHDFSNEGDYNKVFCNDTSHWNYKYWNFSSGRCLYLPEAIGEISDDSTDNPLELLMMYYAALLGNFRTNRGRGRGFSAEEEEAVFLNGGYLSLYEAYKALKRNRRKEARDCFMFSTIICKDIEQTEGYQYLSFLLKTEDSGSTLDFMRKMPMEYTLNSDEKVFA